MRKLSTIIILLILSAVCFGQKPKPKVANTSVQVGNPDVVASLAKLKKELANAENEKAELLVKYTPDYFKVKQVEEKIQAINEAIEKLSAQSVKNVPTASVLSFQEMQTISEITALKTISQLCGMSPDRLECADIESKYQVALTNVVKFPRVLNFLIADTFSKYESMKPNVRSAPQASQIADEHNAEILNIIAIQNQRIIELLEKLVQKR